jgi:hypothetical protein
MTAHTVAEARRELVLSPALSPGGSKGCRKVHPNGVGQMAWRAVVDEMHRAETLRARIERRHKEMNNALA